MDSSSDRQLAALAAACRRLTTQLRLTLALLALAAVAAPLACFLLLDRARSDATSIAIRHAAALFERVKLAAATYPSVRARAIELVDEKNQVRAALTLDPDGGLWQKFFDPQRGERLRVGLTADGISRVRLFDEKQKARLSSSVTRTDAKARIAGTTFFGDDEKPLLSLLTDDGATARMDVSDRKGKIRLSQGVDSDGWVYQSFSDPDGKLRLQTNVSAKSQVNFLLQAAGGKNHFTVSDSVQGGTSLQLLDASGRPRIAQSVGPKGNPAIELSDAQGRTRLGLQISSENRADLWLYGSSGNALIGLSTFENNRSSFAFWDANSRGRLGQGITEKGLAYFENYGVDAKIKMSVHTGADGTFTSYVYKTPGERAWETTSNIMTGVDILERLFR
ncbi:MAG: hypothetical protein RLZZ15_3699 [Verrucomicrobiota bacterium]|jgi:hypothetical protein